MDSYLAVLSFGLSFNTPFFVTGSDITEFPGGPRKKIFSFRLRSDR